MKGQNPSADNPPAQKNNDPGDARQEPAGSDDEDGGADKNEEQEQAGGSNKEKTPDNNTPRFPERNRQHVERFSPEYNRPQAPRKRSASHAHTASSKNQDSSSQVPGTTLNDSLTESESTKGKKGHGKVPEELILNKGGTPGGFQRNFKIPRKTTETVGTSAREAEKDLMDAAAPLLLLVLVLVLVLLVQVLLGWVKLLVLMLLELLLCCYCCCCCCCCAVLLCCCWAAGALCCCCCWCCCHICCETSRNIYNC